MKKIFACILVFVLLVSQIPVFATSILGTNKALGSPILDNSFTNEDWNKWEMVVWGIFLSNFAVPFVDDYNTAFNADAAMGSKGAGFRALQFGAGSDAGNKATIENLLNYAVNQQKSGGLREVYVQGKGINRAKVYEGDGTTDTILDKKRPAQVSDLLLATSENGGDFFANTGCSTDLYRMHGVLPDREGDVTTHTATNASDYLMITTINDGILPVFTVESEGGDEVVLDYTQSWDAQVVTSLIGRGMTSELSDEFISNLCQFYGLGEAKPLYLDCFGNIVVQHNGSNIIIVPACVNQHLTESPRVNLLNSLVFNGYPLTMSTDDIVLAARQQEEDMWLGLFKAARTGGLPAFGCADTGLPSGGIVMYYDLDTVLYQNYFNGGFSTTGAVGSEQVRECVQSSVTKTVNGVNRPVNITHYGKGLLELFSLDVNKGASNKYALKMEAMNLTTLDKSKFSLDDCYEKLMHTACVAGEIANIVGDDADAVYLTKLKTTAGEVDIFGDAVVTAVQMNEIKDGSKLKNPGVAKLFINHLYDAFEGGVASTAGNINRQDVVGLLQSSQSATVSGFEKNIEYDANGNASPFLASFIANHPNLYKIIDGVNPPDLVNYPPKNNEEKNLGLLNGATELKFDGNIKLDNYPGRVIKLYPTSEVMRAVGNVLGVREGSEFSLYSTYIYMTYLDWYKVEFSALSGESTSDLNSSLFSEADDIVQVDIATLAEHVSQEDKEKQVVNLAYMMLHPEYGREYRTQIYIDNINTGMYEQYNRIVYGSSSTIYSKTYTNLAKRTSSGFLRVDNFSENYLTAWFFELYQEILIVLLIGFVIVILVMGIIKGHKISWFLINMILIVNALLLLPSVAEFTPYALNNVVQNMFQSKMTYWSLSEAIRNGEMESDYLDGTTISDGYLSELSPEEQSKLMQLVKALNVVYLDRALMIKSDMSNKMIEAGGTNFSEIQKLRTARWLLPMLMRQFSAEDKSAQYVYKPLCDYYDDASNYYWFYNPKDAEFSGTIIGSQAGVVGTPLSDAEIAMLYRDYQPNGANTLGLDTNNYRNKGYTRGQTTEQMSHKYFYYLRDLSVLNLINRDTVYTQSTMGSKAFYRDYLSHLLTNFGSTVKDDFDASVLVLEDVCQTYNSQDRSSVCEEYGYIASTESPMYYLYQSIKSNFEVDLTLGALVGYIQGQYVQNGGEEHRDTFMSVSHNGAIRDVLDLEHMFVNMIPYLYETQLLAGGFDGGSGVLGEDKIQGYETYSFMNRSWLYRSNWVTKIIESPELSRRQKVRKMNGEWVEIENPTLYYCYPDDRPMIFSEAQMIEMGLDESALSLVELQLVETNKRCAEEWTLLLNYANVKNLKKEILLRQMALDATLIFCNELSPTNAIGSKYALYPRTVDLRSITFDSVMKILLLNITKDTAYVYGDCMKTVMNEGSFGSGVALLICAALCCNIIPFLRNLGMAMMLFLGLFSLLWSILAYERGKMRTITGYILSNLVFFLATFAYYLVFIAMMSITTIDSVVDVDAVRISSGKPIFLYLIIMLVSVIYIVFMYKFIVMCFKNYRDMGASIFESFAVGVKDAIQNVGGNSTVNANSDVDINIENSSSVVVNNENPTDYVEGDNDIIGGYTGGEMNANFGAQEDGTDIDEEIRRGQEQRENIFGNTSFQDVNKAVDEGGENR